MPSEIIKVQERIWSVIRRRETSVLYHPADTQHLPALHTSSRSALMVSTVKDRIHVLDNHRQTLQPHTGINVLLNQRGIVTVAVVVKLA